jgi:signal transduction histidine kinase
VGVVVVDAPSGRLIMANDQHEQLLRYMLVPGATLWEQCGRKAYHMDGRPYTYSDWPIAKTIHAGETVLDQEIWTERGDGSRICLSINAAPIFDGDGVISAAVIAFTDVTEHKEIAEERAMLARRLINAQEEERLRLARELHDEMGQDLTALSLGLKALETLDDLHDLRCSARGIRKIVEHMSVQVHQTGPPCGRCC